MNNELDGFVRSYQDDFPYAFDNKIIINWYPHRILELGVGDSILELGIGHGYSTHVLNAANHRHVVIEGSTEIINNFKTGNLNITIVKDRFETFDTNERFDTIVMGFVLEHVEDPVYILKRYSNFLTPGGSIYAAVPNAESLHRRVGHYAGVLEDMNCLSQSDLQLGHKRLYTVESLREQLDNASLKVVALEGIFLKPLMTSQMQKLDLPAHIIKGFLEIGIFYPELCAGILSKAVKK